jgi:hypothetical protein
MRIITLTITLLILVLYSHAQTPQGPANSGRRVRVKDWGRAIFIFPPNYWNNKEEAIINQIGDKEFQKMKMYSDSRNIPCQFLMFCEDRDGNPLKNLDTLGQRLGQLNIYRIATFSHTDSKNNTHEWAILRIPYNENRNWDPAVKWDSLYFVMRADVTEIIN